REAYAMRASVNLQMLHSQDYRAILADIDQALALKSSDSVTKAKDLYSLRASIEFRMGLFGKALDDLEKALREDYEDPAIFQTTGTKPDKPDDLWKEADLTALAARFPRDYRGPLFHGLYLKSFVLFEDSRHQLEQRAVEEFQKAAQLNPRSALPAFYSATLQNVFIFGKTVREASDEGQKDPRQIAMAQ